MAKNELLFTSHVRDHNDFSAPKSSIITWSAQCDISSFILTNPANVRLVYFLLRPANSSAMVFVAADFPHPDGATLSVVFFAFAHSRFTTINGPSLRCVRLICFIRVCNLCSFFYSH